MTRRDLRKKISTALTLSLDRKISVTHPLVLTMVDIAESYWMEAAREPKVIRGKNRADRHKSMVDDVERNL